VVAANSSGVLGFPVDEVYAGDLQGNLWAIDVGDSIPAKWKVRLLFQARDSSGNPQPITTAPVVTLNPNYPSKLGLMVFFGTGQLLQNSDLTNTNTQSFYGVWDNDSGVPATRANLQQQTLTQTTITNVSGATQAVRTSTSNPVDWSTRQGWYEDLPLSGERVISAAVIENGGVVFDTYTPNSGGPATCAVGGQSWLMDVAYGTGGPFDKAELDVFGNGNLNSPKQQAGGQNPVGMAVGNSYVPTPTIMHAAGLGGGVGDIKVIPTVNKAGTPVPSTVKERGHGPTRAGWWQIQ
jgi:type IV pilus assembly protein PilY1